MNVDSFQHMVATEGFARWREPSWPESQALTSVVAAHQYRTPIKLLNRYLGRGDSRAILDWGSGSAVFSYALAAEGHRVSAIDLVRPPMEEFIQRKTDGRFAFTTASDPVILPFDDETFDVVLSMGCLEHVRETEGNEHRSLIEVQRVMKPGGVFICCHFPNRYSYIEAVARGMSRSSLYAHPFRYTRDDISALARGTGLSVALEPLTQ